MSLRGVISPCSFTDRGGFDDFVGHMKSAIGKMTGGHINFPDKAIMSNGIKIEGIVQGEIKLNATNDWKTTLFYGFTDSAGDVAPGGVHGSAILKFASTVMNTLGYTLGGTGPASRKMYSGSNLQGFNVQFKWYTPMMGGWKSAITALSYLAWPTAIGANTPPQAPEAKAAEKAKESAEDTSRRNLIALSIRYRDAAIAFKSKIDSIFTGNSTNEDKINKINAVEDKGYKSLQDAKLKYILAVKAIFDGVAKSEQDARIENGNNLCESVINLCAPQDGIYKEIKLDGNTIGNIMNPGANGRFWVDCYEYDLTNDDSPSAFKSDGNEPSIGSKIATSVGNVMDSAKEKALNATGIIGAAGDVISGLGSLVTALMQSFAVNPIPVKLEIFSGTSLKYYFAPLVITSFAITASRETIDGEPVVLTIDVGFDYYLVNATGAPDTPHQIFAGQPIFRGIE